jgi:gamma-glutamylcyclotransferase
MADRLPYFAYGTLLGERHTRNRYPSAQPIGHAVYEGHELGFYAYGNGEGGGCTIIDHPGADLIGVLYRLSDEDMARLMAVDGYERWYERREIDVRLPDGKTARAVTLRVHGGEGYWVPPDEYGRLVTDGAREARLPAEYQARLARIVAEAQG